MAAWISKARKARILTVHIITLAIGTEAIPRRRRKLVNDPALAK